MTGRAVPTCYMCDELATSQEHVPAQCFFPEKKDLPIGIDLRRNLFTVPSCDAHNSHKSRDDQYLWHVITANRGINECGEQMVRTKVFRSFSRRPALMTSLTRAAVPVYTYDSHAGAWHATAKARLNDYRVIGILEQLGRALYFHHFRQKWLDRVVVFPHFIEFDSSVDRDFRREWRNLSELAAAEMASLERIGDNQDAFYYQVKPTGDAMRATFYGGVTVTFGFLPLGAEDVTG